MCVYVCHWKVGRYSTTICSGVILWKSAFTIFLRIEFVYFILLYTTMCVHIYIYSQICTHYIIHTLDKASTGTVKIFQATFSSEDS